MDCCQDIRPLLFRFQEGETTPIETLRVARHRSDCTACKILLARERRLAQMLSEELEDLPVGEEFVQAVMSTLPQERPPRRRNWRGLKLASFAGLIGLLALPGIHGLSVSLRSASTVLRPVLEPESAASSLQALTGLVRTLLVVLDAFAARVPSPPAMLAPGSMLVGSVAVLALAAIVALLAGLGFAVRSLLRADA